MRTHTINAFTLVIAALLSFGLAQDTLAKGKPVNVEVTAANPSEAAQGQELDIIVSGTGFDAGSQVSYLVTGTTDTSQVEVLSVEFISSSELRTRIRPKDAALPSEYDIEVRTSSGRKGKGTTLFRVKENPNQTTCTDTQPAIVYVADHTGYIDQDIVLASATGCQQTILVESTELGGQSVFAPRLKLRDSWGVVVWYTYDTVPWTLHGVVFDFDSLGNIYRDTAAGPSFSYTSPSGFDIVEADVHITDENEVLLAITEMGPLNDPSQRLLSLVNPASGSHQVVLQGVCESEVKCLVPSLRRITWSPSGGEIYYEYNNWINDAHGIARVAKGDTGWTQPVVIVAGEPGGEYVSGPSVSDGGLLAYWYDAGVYKERGRKTRDQRIGIADPDDCASRVYGCLAQDGELGAIRRGQDPAWTQQSTLLFRDVGNNEIREYTDPVVAILGDLIITNAGQFDSVP